MSLDVQVRAILLGHCPTPSLPIGIPSWCLSIEALEKFGRPTDNVPNYDPEGEDEDIEDIEDENSDHQNDESDNNIAESSRKKKKKEETKKKKGEGETKKKRETN